MAVELAGPPVTGMMNFTRVRVLEGSAQLLLGQLRLHAKRVRALAAAFRRETRRLATDAGADLQRIDQNLDRIADHTTIALNAVDAALLYSFEHIAAMDHMAVTVDLEHLDFTPMQRIAGHAQDILEKLRAQHGVAHGSLQYVIEQLVVSANNLAIVIGQPGVQSLEQLRVIIRQMRSLSRTTAELSGRLDVFVQNQGAALQELIPTSSTRDTVLASLAGTAQNDLPAQEGAGTWLLNN